MITTSPIFDCVHLNAAEPVLECAICKNSILCACLYRFDIILRRRKASGTKVMSFLEGALILERMIYPILPDFLERESLFELIIQNMGRVEFGRWRLGSHHIYLTQ